MNFKSLILSILIVSGLMISINLRADEIKPRQISPIIIFVSFSMSETSLKQWMRQGELIHAPVVIRGLINNSFKATIQKMADLTSDHHGGVQLDPTLFRRFQINQVPAVVVWKEANCLANQSCVEDYDVVYGDVTLDFALQKIADQHDVLSPKASQAKAILLGEHHE